MTFRKALAEAADRSFSDGQITGDQYTEVASLVNSESVNRVAALESSTKHILGLSGGIDWMSIVAALQAALPIIIQILQLLQKK